MKKRLLVVLLLLSMLCTMVSCKNKEYGEFYTEDGILQNTHITLTVVTQDLVAPVNELSYTLNETCDFWVCDVKYIKGTDCHGLIEIYEDGAWRDAPKFGKNERETLGNRVIGENTDFSAHQSKKYRMMFYEVDQDENFTVTRYLPLQPGQYRLRLKCEVYAEDENVEIPEGQLEAVAYFTVTAPAE